MFLCSNLFLNNWHRTTRNFIHKYIYKMNKAYLRHLTEAEKFEITFHYEDTQLKVNRQFNLCRQLSESVISFTSRVATNVEKIVKKKNKTGEHLITVSIIVNNEKIENETTLCKDIFTNCSNEVKLKVGNQEFNVIINSPWVNSMVLPSSILANFIVYPAKFDAVYTNRSCSEFKWFKSKNKKEWELIGEGFTYQTTNSDIDNFLKINCLPRNGMLEGPQAEAVSTVQVQASPGYCPFEARHAYTKDKCEGSTFRVISYNILADLYCDSDFTRQELHPYCPPYALEIDYRKQLIVKELLGYNADIICLQEVDKKVFTYDLQGLYEQLGYGSNFCQKRGLVAEGLSCFFNREKFEHLESFRFVLSDEINTNPLYEEIWKRIEPNEALAKRICDRSTVLQANVLKSFINDEVIVVANTHLYFHPDADHIRLLQGGIVIKYLENLIETLKIKLEKRVSLILCGDFNSVPQCGIYQLYTTGRVQEDHIDYTSNVVQAVKVPLQQNFRLESACGTPKYTNFTAGFADCLDYIYYESDKLEVVQVVPLPTIEELQQNTALPSIVFPSDHIALISDLKWR